MARLDWLSPAGDLQLSAPWVVRVPNEHTTIKVWHLPQPGAIIEPHIDAALKDWKLLRSNVIEERIFIPDMFKPSAPLAADIWEHSTK